MNVEDVREGDIVVLGSGVWIPVPNARNVVSITKEEVQESVYVRKLREALGLDVVLFLRRGGASAID